MKNATELLASVKKGNKAAFDELFYLYWDKMYLLAFKLSSDRDLSVTIVQDIFISLWERRAYLDIDHIENYLFRSVKNQVFKSYRSQQMKCEVLQDAFEDFYIEEMDGSIDERIIKVKCSVDKLPEKCREIFTLKKVHNYTIEQIATHFNISSQTVKNQLLKASKQLQADLNL